MSASYGNDTLIGTAGNDVIDLYPGHDSFLGLGGVDLIFGSFGDDTLDGGQGSDTLIGGQGDDSLIGDSYTDWLSYSDLRDPSQGVTVDVLRGRSFGAGGNDSFTGILNVRGGAGDDSIIFPGYTAYTYRQKVFGGGSGNDTLETDFGTLMGGLGDDSLAVSEGVLAAWVSYADLAISSQGVTVDLTFYRAHSFGAGGNDSLSEIRNVLGSAGNDWIRAYVNGAILNGADGNDTLISDSSESTLFGRVSIESTLIGGVGNDSLVFGNDLDLLSYSDLTASSQGVTVNLLSGRSFGAAGNDSFVGLENVTGGAGNDSILGGNGANLLFGADGNNTLDGGAGTTHSSAGRKMIS
jgi:Ca2+-binding RTX toxin-like protein